LCPGEDGKGEKVLIHKIQVRKTEGRETGEAERDRKDEIGDTFLIIMGIGEPGLDRASLRAPP